jgi:hypothetical protein
MDTTNALLSILASQDIIISMVDKLQKKQLTQHYKQSRVQIEEKKQEIDKLKQIIHVLKTQVSICSSCSRARDCVNDREYFATPDMQIADVSTSSSNKTAASHSNRSESEPMSSRLISAQASLCPQTSHSNTTLFFCPSVAKMPTRRISAPHSPLPEKLSSPLSIPPLYLSKTDSKHEFLTNYTEI